MLLIYYFPVFACFQMGSIKKMKLKLKYLNRGFRLYELVCLQEGFYSFLSK